MAFRNLLPSWCEFVNDALLEPEVSKNKNENNHTAENVKIWFNASFKYSRSNERMNYPYNDAYRSKSKSQDAQPLQIDLFGIRKNVFYVCIWLAPSAGQLKAGAPATMPS